MTDKMEGGGFIIRLRRLISQIKYVPLTGGRIGKPSRDQMTSVYIPVAWNLIQRTAKVAEVRDNLAYNTENSIHVFRY